jgi:CO/xanthine dehydrogenase Mo-binding subunit
VQACVPRNQNFDKYQMMRARDLPSESLVSIIVEDDEATGPFGAIGIGEPPTIPVAPAILNAIKNAVGVRFFNVPATSRRVLAALKGEKPSPDGTGWTLPR